MKEIIATPELFGIEDSWIRSVYEKHGERFGTEGCARVEIIQVAARNGWIRIRHYVYPEDDCTRLYLL